MGPSTVPSSSWFKLGLFRPATWATCLQTLEALSEPRMAGKPRLGERSTADRAAGRTRSLGRTAIPYAGKMRRHRSPGPAEQVGHASSVPRPEGGSRVEVRRAAARALVFGKPKRQLRSLTKSMISGSTRGPGIRQCRPRRSKCQPYPLGGRAGSAGKATFAHRRPVRTEPAARASSRAAGDHLPGSSRSRAPRPSSRRSRCRMSGRVVDSSHSFGSRSEWDRRRPWSIPTCRAAFPYMAVAAQWIRSGLSETKMSPKGVWRCRRARQHHGTGRRCGGEEHAVAGLKGQERRCRAGGTFEVGWVVRPPGRSSGRDSVHHVT